jgi:hypothetical protein
VTLRRFRALFSVTRQLNGQSGLYAALLFASPIRSSGVQDFSVASLGPRICQSKQLLKTFGINSEAAASLRLEARAAEPN